MSMETSLSHCLGHPMWYVYIVSLTQNANQHCRMVITHLSLFGSRSIQSQNAGLGL